MAQDIQTLVTAGLKLIAEQKKVKDVEAAGWVADRVPSSGATIYRISAVPLGEPNGTVDSVVIDEQARLVDLPALSQKEKVDFFPAFPRPGTEDVNPAPVVVVAPVKEEVKASVTINPNVNVLQLAPGEVFSEDITVTTPKTADPLFDVYFLADTTGSMSSILNAVKAGAANIMTTLQSSYPTMAFGVGNYKDFPKDQHTAYCFQNQQALSVNTALSQTAINAWSASGGGDSPEGQLFALSEIATKPGIGWRPNARRIIVWFGDAPGHDPICAAYTGAAALTEAQVITSLRTPLTNPIQVLAISTTTGVANGLDGTPSQGSYTCPNTGTSGQGTRIATQTGGSYTAGVNAATISSTILASVTAATNLYSNIKLVPTGTSAPYVTSITPAGGYGPVDNKGHSYVFKVTFTGPPCKETDQVFTGTIDVVADGKVVAQKTVSLTVNACERWSYGVKFLCGYVKESPPGVVPLTPAATLRPGIYATEVNILNYRGTAVTVHKYLYPLIRQGEVLGREPRSVVRSKASDVITLPGKSATFDDCVRLHEIQKEDLKDEPLSIYFLEIVSPVELTVTAVYTANDLRGTSVALEVVQVEGKRL